MAKVIAEFQERAGTDRKLSFGLYLVFLLVAVIISGIIGGIGMIFGGWLLGPVVATAASALVAIYLWWYNWLLYSRRNNHFDRIKRLKVSLSGLLEEKTEVEKGILNKTDSFLERKEAPRPNILFFLWLILSYLGSFSGFSAPLGVLSFVSLIVGLVVLYYLTTDYFYHEQGEIAFLQKVTAALGKKGTALTATPSNPLQTRSFGLYIFLSIITLGIFCLYWAYVIFKDPNKHFDTHQVWESELERIVEQLK